MGNSTNRIAKNTLYLYLRMIITLVVTLYTSRVIVNTLGIEDFGIYNIVGGVIVLFSFISHSLRIASQRFLSYELGKKLDGDENKVFNTCLQTHALMSILFIVLAETVGLWLFNNKLNIPTDRMIAAAWVYQFSVITFVINLFQSPYQASIVSHEQMSFYAIVSIVDVCLKLLIAYLLVIASWDKLVVYSFFMTCVSFISLSIAAVYCYRNFSLNKPVLARDNKLFRDIFSYAGWSMVGGCATLGSQQGGNILLNVFNGVTANAAFGIANQVNNAIYGFVSNFQSAFNPQIVKSYAAGQIKELLQLVNRTALFSYYLLLIIAVPFMIKADYVISLWLGECPEYAAGFCVLMLVYFLMDAIEAPLWMVIGATGKMKVYTIWTAALTIFNIPVSWLLLANDYSVYWVFIIRVIINFISAVIRPFYLKTLVPDFSIRSFMNNTITRAILVTCVIVLPYIVLDGIFEQMNSFLTIIIAFVYTLVVLAIIGLNKSDRRVLVNMVLSKIRKI